MSDILRQYISKKCDKHLNTYLLSSFENNIKFAIICDTNTLEHCLPILLKETERLASPLVLCIDPGESNKNLQSVEKIWSFLTENSFTRNDVIINLGGGVISDLGGFAASTYKRGIPYINIPTSLLSQCDAAIGGKTGFDYAGIKNLIGSFHQPVACFIYTEFLSSLPILHIRSGYAEIVKMALISDNTMWQKMLRFPLKHITDWYDLVTFSAYSKNEFISKDPLDEGIRKKLNFGHTLGHAIEALSLKHDQKPISHGEAVAIGIIGEARVSAKHNLIRDEDLQDIEQYISSNFFIYKYSREHVQELLDLMNADKKNNSDKILCVLLDGIGNAIIDVAVQGEEIIKSVDWL